MRESRTYGSGRGACHERRRTATARTSSHSSAASAASMATDGARWQQAARIPRIWSLRRPALPLADSRAATRHSGKRCAISAMSRARLSLFSTGLRKDDLIGCPSLQRSSSGSTWM